MQVNPPQVRSRLESRGHIVCVRQDGHALEELRADLEEMVPADYRVVTASTATEGLEAIHALSSGATAWTS